MKQLWLETQSSALHSIVYNLLDNAIKYTPEQGVINVSIYQQDQQAIVQIEDSGPGIAPELYDHILKRFYRVHHHLEVGSGLGLSIVDKAAEKNWRQTALWTKCRIGRLTSSSDL